MREMSGTLGETFHARQRFDGAVAQLQRLAEKAGYKIIWHKPSDPSVWFCERPGATPGTIDVIKLDELITEQA